MKRILAVLAGLTALTILGLFLLRDIGPRPAAVQGPATSMPAAAAPAPAGALDLKLSRRLARAPDGPPAAAAPATGPDTVPRQPQSLRYLAYLLAALLIGVAMSLAWRKPTPAPIADSPDLQSLQGELAERDDAIRALEVEFEQRVSDQAVGFAQPLQHELDAQSEELERLRHELQQRDEALESHVRQINEQVERTSDLEDEISAAVKRADHLQHELANRDIQLKESEEQKLAAIATAKLDLRESEEQRQATLTERQEQLDGLEQELGTWKDSVSALENELDERLARMDTLEQDKAAALAAGAKLQDERDQFQSTVQTLRDQLESNAFVARTERDEGHGRIHELEDSLHKRTLQIDDLGAQLDEKNALIDELRNSVETGHQQILAAETRIGDLHGYRDKLNSWESTLQTLRADLDRRDAVIDELRATTGRLGKTEQQVLEQQKTISELEAELESSGALARSLKRGVDTLRHYKDVCEQRQQTVQELHGDLQEAHDEIEQWRNRIPVLEKAISERDGQIDTLQARIDRHGMDANELETELADWRVKVTALETALRERDAGLDDLRTHVETVSAERDSLTASLEESQEVRASLSAELENVSAKLHDTSAQLQQEKDERQALADETQRLGDIEDKLQEWNSTVTTLRADLRERDRALHTLLDDFGGVIGSRVSVQGWAAALDDLRSGIDGREKEIERYSQEAARLEELAGQLPERDETIEALRNSLSQGQTENDELRGRIAELDARLVALSENEQEIERLQHEVDERNADLEAMRSELERNQNAVMRAEELELGAEKDRRQLTALHQDLRERDERIDDLEMDVAEWIDKHARIRSQVESLEDRLAAFKSQAGEEPDQIPTLRTRAPGTQSVPTLTAVVRRPTDDNKD